jgi:hypothetical protein
LSGCREPYAHNQTANNNAAHADTQHSCPQHAIRPGSSFARKDRYHRFDLYRPVADSFMNRHSGRVTVYPKTSAPGSLVNNPGWKVCIHRTPASGLTSGPSTCGIKGGTRGQSWST